LYEFHLLPGLLRVVPEIGGQGSFFLVFYLYSLGIYVKDTSSTRLGVQ